MPTPASAKPGFPVERLTCPALQDHPHGAVVSRVLAAALAAVEPKAAVQKHMRRQGDTLWIGGKAYQLDHIRQVRLVGFGKASLPMGQAAAEIVAERLHSGLLITKNGQSKLYGETLDPRLTILEASHPIPDQTSLDASGAVISLLKDLTAQDLVVCLISGGGSALLTAPADGISLDDLQALTGLLLGCGASIFEINALRKHLELLKGGGLARHAAPAQLAALALSDVIGDPLDVIASGPAVPDPTTFKDAIKILERHQLLDRTPAAILTRLHQGGGVETADTPKPGDPIFERVDNLVVGSNRQAALAAVEQASAEGLQARLLTTYLQGEARQAGRFMAALGLEISAGGGDIQKPGCIVLGGETTVTLQGSGLGGRNQELALGAVVDMAGTENLLLVTLATDGGDGPTDAAGAVVFGDTLNRARALGLNPDDFLRRNDAYHFFHPLGALLQPGPTQTNVNDLAFLFAF